MIKILKSWKTIKYSKHFYTNQLYDVDIITILVFSLIKYSYLIIIYFVWLYNFNNFFLCAYLFVWFTIDLLYDTYYTYTIKYVHISGKTRNSVIFFSKRYDLEMYIIMLVKFLFILLFDFDSFCRTMYDDDSEGKSQPIL